MKKYIAVALALMLTACVFTACGKKPQGTEAVTIEGGSTLAVITKEDGGLDRNEHGDIMMVVTEENGNVVTDAAGEQETTRVNLKTAFVYDNKIEFENYYLEIPDGWSNSSSWSDLVISKDGSDERISIMRSEEKTLEEAFAGTQEMFTKITEMNPDAVQKKSGINIGDDTITLLSCYSETKEDKTYLAYGYLEKDGALYTFMISAKHDLSEDFSEIEKILNSVEFK
jgi:hypothetical protein